MKRSFICVLIASFVFWSCGKSPRAEEKARPTEKADGFSVSDWTERTELFMEHPALVAGQNARFAVHFTRLDNFQALKDGTVEIVLTGADGVQKFSTPNPSRPGIFGVDVKPAKSGKYSMTVDDFNSSRFVRLRRIRELLTAGTVDEMLRRTAPQTG